MLYSVLYGAASGGTPISLGTIATTGTGVTSLSLVAIRVLAPATVGNGVSATPLIGVRVVSSATLGVGAASATLTGIRVLGAGASGVGSSVAGVTGVRVFGAGTQGNGVTTAAFSIPVSLGAITTQGSGATTASVAPAVAAPAFGGGRLRERKRWRPVSLGAIATEGVSRAGLTVIRIRPAATQSSGSSAASVQLTRILQTSDDDLALILLAAA